MNYQRIYNAIISNRLAHPFVGYTEKHHIVPRSLGGSDDSSNLVNLSAREHFICHYLLIRIYKNDVFTHAKMLKAFMMMFVKSSNHQRYSPSRLYSKLREEFAKIQSQSQTGTRNSQFGKIWIYSKDLKQSKKILITDPIPEGWSKGRVINFNRIEKKKKEKLRKETDRIQLQEWYKIYASVGFDEFVKITGYKYSKPNLVQLFAKWVPGFNPQNGKKRKLSAGGMVNAPVC